MTEPKFNKMIQDRSKEEIKKKGPLFTEQLARILKIEYGISMIATSEGKPPIPPETLAEILLESDQIYNDEKGRWTLEEK